MLIHQTLTDFLDETASSSPAPGGGSVSALAASLSMALTSMVCRLTIGKKKYANVETEMTSVLARSEELRNAFQTLIDADTSAFQSVMRALAMPKETEDQKAIRAEAIEEATKQATQVPLEVLRRCAQAVGLVQVVAENGNSNSRSDAGVASLLLGAAAHGAFLNVTINLAGLKDAEHANAVRGEAVDLQHKTMDACGRLTADVTASLSNP